MKSYLKKINDSIDSLMESSEEHFLEQNSLHLEDTHHIDDNNHTPPKDTVLYYNLSRQRYISNRFQNSANIAIYIVKSLKPPINF